MAVVRIQEAASHRLDEIYRYTRDRWGREQADRYITRFVYWRRLSNGDIGIVTILHERMHQIGRFGEDFSL